MRHILEWAYRTFRPERKASSIVQFPTLFNRFQQILSLNGRALELIAQANDKLGGQYVFDRQYIHAFSKELEEVVHQLITNLEGLAPLKYAGLQKAFRRINYLIEEEFADRLVVSGSELVIAYDKINNEDIIAVGGKNARLAEMKNILGLKVPEGFAITALAFQLFMNENGLWPKIEQLTSDWHDSRISGELASSKIMSLIYDAKIPEILKKTIDEKLAGLKQASEDKKLLLAVRSSAWGEDGEYSFAGQYRSILNVREENVLDSYKKVIASTFSASAMEYRRQNGFLNQEIAMAVGCQVMIDAMISGVIYTATPSVPQHDSLMISAAWGLGEPIVSGEISADQFTVSRGKPHRISAVNLVRKEKKLILQPEGGTTLQSVDDSHKSNACLESTQINQLATTALEIEQFFRSFMDIEFAINHSGEQVILQARPLKISASPAEQSCDISVIARNYPVLMQEKGVIAQKGISAGKVFIVRNNEDLDEFPSGAILVARQASPLFAKVMRKARGIITDVGSPTCHMATIAREFRVPTIVNTGNATELFKTGQELTLDAEENIIYGGTIDELCFYGLNTERLEETYEYRLLRRILKQIEPLSLIDPTARNFTPEGCKSYHDIIRFVHEKAVQELIDLHYDGKYDYQSHSGKLLWSLPLDMIVIDIGGGISNASNSKEIAIDQITSQPMAAFVKGLNTPGAWNNEPLSVDIGSFMSSLTKTFSAEVAGPRFVGQNLAILSKEYASITLRLGYHFSLINAYMSENLNDNYIYFRFAGGVTDTTRRSRRAKLLEKILAENNFMVEVHDDLVIGRIKKIPIRDVEKKISLLGLLVGFTRQLDVLLTSDQQVYHFIERFAELAGDTISNKEGLL